MNTTEEMQTIDLLAIQIDKSTEFLVRFNLVTVMKPVSTWSCLINLVEGVEPLVTFNLVTDMKPVSTRA